MDLDLVLTGGQIATSGELVSADVGIAEGRIVELAGPGRLDSVRCKERVDVGGCVVVPGGIDPHIHCSWPLGNPGGGEHFTSGDPGQVSRAALFGGTTTLIDFAPCVGDEPLQAAIERRSKEYADCWCDYSFHVMLQGQISEKTLNAVPDVIRDGFTSFKVFTTDVRPARKDRRVPLGSLWELLKVMAPVNGVLAVHAEDDELVKHNYERLARLGKSDVKYLPEVHSKLSEDISFNTITRLASHVPGAIVYFMHVSAREGVEAIHEARSRGQVVFGECLHQYALKTWDEYSRPDGLLFHTYPSLKSADDVAALWDGVVAGDLVTFATDEECTPKEVKLAGQEVHNVVGGNTGVEPRMGILYSEIVQRRGLGIETFVNATSTNAAKIMGMFPRKGVIAIGSDADLAIIDPQVNFRLTANKLHESDFTPWEGFPVTAWPRMTVARGKLATADGQWLCNERGTLLTRSTDRNVLRTVGG